MTKHTALFERHRRAAISLAECYGWQVPACFASSASEISQIEESVGLADVSWMTKLDLKGYGLKTPLSLGARAHTWTLGPGHLLVTCEPSDRGEVLERLRPLQAVGPDLYLPAPVSVTEVTSVYAQFLLAGPRSRDVLSKLTSLKVRENSLPNLSCGQTSLAHVRGIVLRQDIGKIPAFHLLVGREYGESFWDAVMHAGHEWHLCPFGAQAYDLLKA